jgi:hypothetical protein
MTAAVVRVTARSTMPTRTAAQKTFQKTARDSRRLRRRPIFRPDAAPPRIAVAMIWPSSVIPTSPIAAKSVANPNSEIVRASAGTNCSPPKRSSAASKLPRSRTRARNRITAGPASASVTIPM